MSIPDPLSVETVQARLSAAGATLFALPNRGHALGARCGWPEIVRSAQDAYGWLPAEPVRLRPSPADVTEMDEALSWIGLIPHDRYVLRRIVGARALTRPGTGKPVFSWRRIAAMIGADDKSAKLWHDQGIALIVGALARRQRRPHDFPCADSANLGTFRTMLAERVA